MSNRPAPTVWGSKLPFNTICGEYASPAGGWVHTVGFSPSGEVLAFASEFRFRSSFIKPILNCVGHDSSISIVYPNGPVIHNIRMPTLPLVSLIWTSEDTIVAAGHDCRPLVFSGTENGWQEAGTLDDPTAPKSPESRSGFGSSSSVGRLKTGAFATFRDADTRGQSSAGSASPTTDTKMLTIHQNTITNVRPYVSSGANVTKVSTSGVDGMLVIWDVNAVTALTGRLGGAHLR
jgi:actin related protein 2/3 complex subunit 1A/1B